MVAFLKFLHVNKSGLQNPTRCLPPPISYYECWNKMSDVGRDNNIFSNSFDSKPPRVLVHFIPCFTVTNCIKLMFSWRQAEMAFHCWFKQITSLASYTNNRDGNEEVSSSTTSASQGCSKHNIQNDHKGNRILSYN